MRITYRGDKRILKEKCRGQHWLSNESVSGMPQLIAGHACIGTCLRLLNGDGRISDGPASTIYHLPPNKGLNPLSRFPPSHDYHAFTVMAAVDSGVNKLTPLTKTNQLLHHAFTVVQRWVFSGGNSTSLRLTSSSWRRGRSSQPHQLHRHLRDVFESPETQETFLAGWSNPLSSVRL